MGLVFVIQKPTYLRCTVRLHGRAHLDERPAVTFRGDESKAQKCAALANTSLSFVPTPCTMTLFCCGQHAGGTRHKQWQRDEAWRGTEGGGGDSGLKPTRANKTSGILCSLDLKFIWLSLNVGISLADSTFGSNLGETGADLRLKRPLRWRSRAATAEPRDPC